MVIVIITPFVPWYGAAMSPGAIKMHRVWLGLLQALLIDGFLLPRAVSVELSEAIVASGAFYPGDAQLYF